MKPMLRLIAFLLAVTGLCGGAWADELNLLPNPGFEGATPAWSLTPEAQIVADRPHGGQCCLRITRSDKTAYTLPTMAMKLQPGWPYEMSVWVRTAKVTQGEAGAATICMQWSKGGAFYNGEYPLGLSGDNDWTLVKTIAKVPADADPEVGITLYLRRESTGTAWFDDITVRPVSDYPPVDCVFTYQYRNTTAGETVRVGATLDLDWARMDPVTARVRLQARDDSGKVLATLKPVQLSAKGADFRLVAARLKPGKYTLACGIEAKGRLRGERTCILQRVDKYPKRYAYLDQTKRLIVNGKPMFPLGTYWNSHYHLEEHTAEQRQAIYEKYSGSRDRKLLDLYAKSPFNCLMPYDSWNWQTADLDYLQTRGLKVIFSVKDSFFGTCDSYHMKSADDERATLDREVKRVGQHPAVIAWYTNDEVPPEDPRLLQHQRWMEELDPSRPTWAVSYHDHGAYVGTSDAYGMDWYPVPWAEPSGVLAQARAAAAGAGSSRALWHVPQISDVGTYGKDIRKSRPPTLDELRAMSWMCIAAGANGLVYYSFFDLIRAEGVEPFEPRWRDITQMAQEIKDLEPVLLSVRKAPRPIVAPGPADPVAWRIYSYRGDVYLASVNSVRKRQTATFSFPCSFTAATNVLGRNTWRLDGPSLTVRYRPLEVQILRLQGAGQP